MILASTSEPAALRTDVHPVRDVPDAIVESLYEEARGCIGIGAHTASVLCCRKLLMHIAVSVGAPPDAKFYVYVDYLADNDYIPPGAKGWVDNIRENGNEANHEIVLVSREEAEEFVAFSGMLMKRIYELPAMAKRRRGS